jgi:hypothetical protein
MGAVMVALVPTSVADALHRLDSFPQEERWISDRMEMLKWIFVQPPEDIFADVESLTAFTEVKLMRHEVEVVINKVEETRNKEYAANIYYSLANAVLDPVIPLGNATDMNDEQAARLRKLADLPEEK